MVGGRTRGEKTKRPSTCQDGQRTERGRGSWGAGLSESLSEGATLRLGGGRGGLGLFVGGGGGEKAGRKRASFCYCVEEGEKDGGIISMAYA